MICSVCCTPIPLCKCQDRDERLREAAYDPNGVVMMKWCRLCDKHYACCTCEQPQFYIIFQGREFGVPAAGINTLAGPIVPDLQNR